MRECDLVTVGEAFEDLVFVGLPRVPRPGEELKTESFLATSGGGAVITAVAAARLGLRTAVLSALPPATSVLLRKEKVLPLDLRRPGEPHALSVAISTPRDRSFVTFEGINPRLEGRLLRSLRLLERQVRFRHVHFALYPRPCRRWLPVLRRLGRSGHSTSWDFGWNPALAKDPDFLELVSHLDVVSLNEVEALAYSRARSLEGARRFWSARAKSALLKLGPRGTVWVRGERSLEARGRRVSVVDTTGAGDSFNGGFLFGLLTGRSPRECLRLGNAVGAASVQAAGGIAGLPRRGELP